MTNNETNIINDVFKSMKQLEIENKIKLLDFKYIDSKKILDIKYSPIQKIEKIKIDFVISPSGFTCK